MMQNTSEIPAITVHRLTTLEEVERAYITKVLERTLWRVGGRGGAAEILGLNPNTLRSRMRKLGLRRPDAILDAEPNTYEI
jgi:formate hydrogenlyase transcriptional activator